MQPSILSYFPNYPTSLCSIGIVQVRCCDSQRGTVPSDTAHNNRISVYNSLRECLLLLALCAGRCKGVGHRASVRDKSSSQEGEGVGMDDRRAAAVRAKGGGKKKGWDG